MGIGLGISLEVNVMVWEISFDSILLMPVKTPIFKYVLLPDCRFSNECCCNKAIILFI